MIGLAAFSFAAAGLASAAAAEPDPPDPPSVLVNYTDALRSGYGGRRALEVVHRSARCIVGRARSASENLVAAVPGPALKRVSCGDRSQAASIVAGNAGLVRRVLETEPFSQGERDTLRELRPRLDPCLDAGRTYSINRESLRAVLAESLYRWASIQRAARPASDGTFR